MVSIEPVTRQEVALARLRIGRSAHAGELPDLAALRLRIQALRIALAAYRPWCVDEHLDELALGQDLAHQAAVGTERRDECRQRDQTGVGHQLGDLADTADVLLAVRITEAEVTAQAVA